jgi:hypothetical protein
MTVKLERIWFYAGLISLISVIGILIVFSDRGFDFTDEGTYALLSNPNQENRNSLFNYDIIFKYLYQYFGITLNLIELRLLRVILVLLGSFYLIIPVYLLNKESIIKIISPRLFFIIGLLLGFWSYAPLFLQTPNYYSFHFLGIQLFIGSLLFFHTTFNSNQIIRTLLFSSISFLGFILCWLSKISGIPVLIFIFILQYFIKSEKPIVWHLLLFILFTLNFIAFISFHPELFKNLFQNIINELFQKSSSHSLDNQIKNLLLNFILTLSAFLSGIFYRAKLYFIKRKTILVLLASLLLFAMYFIYLDFNNSKIKNYNYQPDFFIKYLIVRSSISMLLLLSFFTGFSFDSNLFNKKFIPILILNLGILAFVIGTNHILLFQSISSIQFLILSWFYLDSRRIQKNIAISFIPITLFIFFCFIFYTNIANRQNKLINATHKYYYGKKKNDYIFLDKESFLIQRKIKSIIEKDSINYILGYDRLLGFIYLSGYSYTSPGSYLYGEDIDIYFRKKFTYPKSMQLILNGDKSKKAMFPYLKNYTLILKDSIYVYLPHRYKEKTQFYFYKCNRKN